MICFISLKKEINLATRTRVSGIWEVLESGSRKTKKLATVQGRGNNSDGGEERQLLGAYLEISSAGIVEGSVVGKRKEEESG